MKLEVLALWLCIGLALVLFFALLKVRKKAKMAEVQANSILQSSPDVILRVDRSGNCLDLKKVEEFDPFISSKGKVGSSIVEMFPDGSTVIEKLTSALDSSKPSIFEYCLPEYGTKMRDYEGRIVPTSDSEALLLIRDITERKYKDILDTVEKAQRRAGQDLHDGVSQHLTGIACVSQGLAQTLSAKSLPEVIDAQMIVKWTNEAIAQTRVLARGLYPVDLLVHGLVFALEELSSNTAKMFGVNCEFNGEKNIQIEDNNAATHLYRIAQEALNNAIKHGKAKNVILNLTAEDGKLLLMIKDDGVGFSEFSEQQKGMGLHIMNYRARTIGATIDFQGHPMAGEGTTLLCSLPLSNLTSTEPSYVDVKANA